MKVVLEIFFLIFNKANIQFMEQHLVCKIYKTAKALLITRQVEIIDKFFLIIAALDKKN